VGDGRGHGAGSRSLGCNQGARGRVALRPFRCLVPSSRAQGKVSFSRCRNGIPPTFTAFGMHVRRRLSKRCISSSWTTGAVRRRNPWACLSISGGSFGLRIVLSSIPSSACGQRCKSDWLGSSLPRLMSWNTALKRSSLNIPKPRFNHALHTRILCTRFMLYAHREMV
jgi:hypothetical protein